MNTYRFSIIANSFTLTYSEYKMILQPENNITTYLRIYRMSVFIEIKILIQNSYITHVSHSFKMK